MITEHGHRDMRPVSYRERRLDVAKGVNVVVVPEPVYDEDFTLICNVCAEYGAAQERKRLRGPMVEYVATAISGLPDGGGVTHDEARKIGARVALAVFTVEEEAG